MPGPFRRDHPDRLQPRDRRGVAIILDDLQIMLARDLRNRLTALVRHPRRGRVLRIGRHADHLPAIAPTGGIERLGDHPLLVELHRHHLGPAQPRGMAKARIGQLLAQHHRPVAAQTALQHDRDAVLPAMSQHQIIGADLPMQRAMGKPVQRCLAAIAVAAQAGIFQIMLAQLGRGIGHRLRQHHRLPDIGQLRRAQVDHPIRRRVRERLLIQRFRRAKPA